MQDFYQRLGIQPKEVEILFMGAKLTLRPLPAAIADDMRHFARAEARRILQPVEAELKQEPPDLKDYRASVEKLKEKKLSESEQEITAAEITKPQSRYDEIFNTKFYFIYGLVGGIFCLHDSEGKPVTSTISDAYEFAKTVPSSFVQPLIEAFNKVNEAAEKNGITSESLPLSGEKTPE